MDHERETLDLIYAITGKDNFIKAYEEAAKRFPNENGGQTMNTKGQSLLEVYYQGGVKHGFAQGFAQGLAQGKILSLYELVQQGILDWDVATQAAGMGTDRELFQRTALQYQMEEAQRPNEQAM